MKKAISKLIIGALIFTGFCVSPLSINEPHHNQMKDSMSINHHMDDEGLACCESHGEEVNLITTLNNTTGSNKVKADFLNKRLPDTVSLNEGFKTEDSPTRPPAHKYLANIIRLE